MRTSKDGMAIFYLHHAISNSDKYRLKRKEKNKSHEEIFYQMKGFFFV